MLISIGIPKPPTYMHGNHACMATPMVAIHQHIPILSNLHTYPCTSPPSYPCKLSTFVYPSPHVHANLPCSHTLSNMHGHPPWTLSLTTYSSPIYLSSLCPSFSPYPSFVPATFPLSITTYPFSHLMPTILKANLMHW